MNDSKCPEKFLVSSIGATVGPDYFGAVLYYGLGHNSGYIYIYSYICYDIICLMCINAMMY